MPAAPMAWRGSTLARIGALVGAGIAGAGLFLIRVPNAPLAGVIAWPLRAPYRLPATLLAGVGLFIIALPLLFLVRLPTRSHGETVPRSASLIARETIVWVASAVLLLAGLVVLQHRAHRLSMAFLPWLALLAWGAWHLHRLDRNRGVSTRFGLSRVEAAALAGVAIAGGAWWLGEASSWKYAMIGDEWGFFDLARKYAAAPFWSWDVFATSGAFGDLPVAVSILQGVVMRLFGRTLLGWKASGAAMLLIALPFLYRWVREEVGRFGAWISVGVYLSSLLVVTWARIGKPCAFLAPALVATVCLVTLARRGSLLFAYLAGTAAGTGWFLFSLSALASAAYLAVILGASLIHQWRGRAVEQIGVALAGWLVGVGPILVQPHFIVHLFLKNVGEPGLHSAVPNTIHTAAAFLSYSAGDHFIAGHVCDVLSAFLILIGIAACLRAGLRSPLLLWALCIAYVGTLAYYGYLPMTRMLMMALPWAALAGAGAAWLRTALPLGRSLAVVAAIALGGGVVVLNATALGDDDPRYLNRMMWIARYLQDHPDLGRLLYVTLLAEDTTVDSVALAAYHPGARAVRDSVAAEAVVTDAKAAGSRGLVVVLGPYLAVSPELAAALIDRMVPTFDSREGYAAGLPREPPLLTRRQIMALVPEPGPPVLFDVVSWSRGWNVFLKGHALSGSPVRIREKYYAQGLGTAAPSRVEISFKPRYETFSGLCGVDTSPYGGGLGVCRIMDGTKVLFESPLLRPESPPASFRVPVGGLSGLVLTIGDGGGQTASGRADWVNLELR